MIRTILFALGLSAACSCASAAPLPHPILFVTQVPTGYDNVTMTISTAFANHLPTTLAAPRGGDLVLLSTTGALRYLTQEAGYSTAGGAGLLTGNQAVAVRDPADGQPVPMPPDRSVPPELAPQGMPIQVFTPPDQGAPD